LFLLTVCFLAFWFWRDILRQAVDSYEVKSEDKVICCQSSTKDGGGDLQCLTDSLASATQQQQQQAQRQQQKVCWGVA